MTLLSSIVRSLVVVAMVLLARPEFAAAEIIDLAPDLSPVREEFQFPALGAAVIVEGRLHALGVVGVRKYDSEVKAEPNDAFHLGSCTKAMTGSLIGLLVEQGKLKWDTPLIEYFPEMKDTMHPDYRQVTLVHLLSHRAGVPPMTAGFGPATPLQLLEIRMMQSPVEQRKRIAEIVLTQGPVNKPGEKCEYSNAGFAIAGAIAERVMGESYEDLLTRMLFEPLGMKTAGFGAMGTPGQADAQRPFEPRALWQHRMDGDKIIPIEPGPLADNPPFLTPGGRVHCSMADWARYVQCVLAAARGETSLLPASCVEQLKQAPFGGEYALGWGLCNRDWAGGTALSHGGSNTMNYSIVWLAPRKDFAVLVATNRGGDGAAEGLDKLCGLLIKKFLAGT
ncbi:MAG: serine hydrolase domain-containing protein [Solirubrobacterales bacterium]